MEQSNEEHEMHAFPSAALVEEAEAMNGPSIEDSSNETEALIRDRDDLLPSGRDQDASKRAVRKLDFILLPFLALLFLLNSLDKSNIGNAETAGFTRDAGLSADDLNTSMACFFAFFVALQPVGAALGRRYGMARWVPVCMSLWGLCTILHILVRHKWQLVLLRIVIASLEAGFYPTTVSYLSLFYTRYEFAVRLGFFYGQSAIAGALGGLLSWAVFSHFPTPPAAPRPPPTETMQVRQASGSAWHSWEVLFLIEGCTTMAVALVGFFWLPHSAETAWFFTASERRWAEERIRLDHNESSPAHRRRSSKSSRCAIRGIDQETHGQPSDDDENDNAGTQDGLLRRASSNSMSRRRKLSTISGVSLTNDSGLTRHDILSAFLGYKIWHLLACNILSAIPATAFGVFLPLVIKQLSPGLNLSPAQSNVLAAPPFVCGAIVLWAFMYWSDRSRQRIVPILYALGLLLVGLTATILSGPERYALRYLSLCVLLSGSFIASPLTVAWLSNNTPEPGKRAILLGINGWGNLAGVFSALLFTPEDAKSAYVRPFIITLICVLGAFVGYIILWVLLVRENKRRDEITAQWTEEQRESEEMFGDVVVPRSTDRAENILEAFSSSLLFERLGLGSERSGDAKLTYRYTL